MQFADTSRKPTKFGVMLDPCRVSLGDGLPSVDHFVRHHHNQRVRVADALGRNAYNVVSRAFVGRVIAFPVFQEDHAELDLFSAREFPAVERWTGAEELVCRL